MNSKINEQFRIGRETTQKRESKNKQLQPLNFNIKEVTNEELEKTLRDVKPVMNTCGLCKLVIGSG